VNGQLLERTVLQQEPVPGENHVIFLETRCVLNVSLSSTQLGLIVDRRGACAVASAANTNPDVVVYLLYTCPVRGGLGASPEYVQQMLSYPNVRIWQLSVPGYMKGTPLENWDFMGKVQSSRWPVPHSSDVLRYVTLWKYGGTYADLDFVFLK
jgi:lactosylceramide 4-alpha-galactosyltransferase